MCRFSHFQFANRLIGKLIAVAFVCSPLIFSSCDSENEPTPPEPPVVTPPEEPEPPVEYNDSASHTIPIMYIVTEDSVPILSKTEYLNATMWIDPCQSDFDAFGSEESPVTLQVRGRGNNSWSGWNKKPYRLKFTDKQKPLGMESNRHFVMIVAQDYMRGPLSTPAGLMLSKRLVKGWTPDFRPVEVFINGLYKGLYFIVEKIRPGKQRVNIMEQPDMLTDMEQIAHGGWLVEKDNYLEDEQVYVWQPDGRKLNITSHSPEVLSDMQRQHLQEQMDAINEAIFNPDKNSTDWEELVDLEDLARFALVQQILDVGDAFDGSCYFHRPGGDDLKWHFGPVWDFDLANLGEDGGDFYDINRNCAPHWIAELMKYPRLQNEVNRIAEEFITSGEFEEYCAELRSFAEMIAPAVAYNCVRWPYPNYGTHNFPARTEEFDNALRLRVSLLFPY